MQGNCLRAPDSSGLMRHMRRFSWHQSSELRLPVLFQRRLGTFCHPGRPSSGVSASSACVVTVTHWKPEVAVKVVSISSSHSDSDLTANPGSSSDLTTRGFGFIREEFSSSRRRLLIFNLQFFQRRTFKVLVIRAFFFPNRLDWRVLNSRRHRSYYPRNVPPRLPIEQQSRVAE